MDDRDPRPPAADIAVIGDRMPGFPPQDAIADALAHAAGGPGPAVPAPRWVGTDDLARDGAPAHLDGAHGVWCAPGGPFRSLGGALAGIRFARERGVPFLGTCAGYQHAVIEIARNVAGIEQAAHGEYGHEGGDLIVHELACSLVGRRLAVRIVDPVIGAVYGAEVAEERYYCRFGLNPAYLPALEAAGLVVAGVDTEDGQPRVMRLTGHPFFVITLFVPQTSSTPDRPHPVVRAFAAAARARAGGPG
jgi:CTP synthase (UTP-ammonia lyase)